MLAKEGRRRRIARLRPWNIGEVTIYVGSKDLRKDGQGGALDLLDDLRTLLTNHRFSDLGDDDALMYPETEDPLFFDKKTGIYWYFTRYAARTTWTV